jgi:ubiquinone/menaquinone biosynthesis C-methylase UbiE
MVELDRLADDLKLWIPNVYRLFENATVLDLGAGRGSLGILIAQRYSPAAVVSSDICHHRLKAATPWRQTVSRLSLICSDAFSLPFGDDTFDFVLANSFLHHLPLLDVALHEIARVLRPGGYYIGREPNFANPALRFAVFKLRGTFLYRATLSSNEYPLRPRQIVDSFARAGCECRLRYFWRRVPWLHHPILSVAMSVVAYRTPS